jgi:hypothetical protein
MASKVSYCWLCWKISIKTAEITEIYLNIYKYKLSLIREEKDICVVYQRDIIWPFMNEHRVESIERVETVKDSQNSHDSHDSHDYSNDSHHSLTRMTRKLAWLANSQTRIIVYLHNLQQTMPFCMINMWKSFSKLSFVNVQFLFIHWDRMVGKCAKLAKSNE